MKRRQIPGIVLKMSAASVLDAMPPAAPTVTTRCMVCKSHQSHTVVLHQVDMQSFEGDYNIVHRERLRCLMCHNSAYLEWKSEGNDARPSTSMGRDEDGEDIEVEVDNDTYFTADLRSDGADVQLGKNDVMRSRLIDLQEAAKVDAEIPLLSAELAQCLRDTSPELYMLVQEVHAAAVHGLWSVWHLGWAHVFDVAMDESPAHALHDYLKRPMIENLKLMCTAESQLDAGVKAKLQSSLDKLFPGGKDLLDEVEPKQRRAFVTFMHAFLSALFLPAWLDQKTMAQLDNAMVQ